MKGTARRKALEIRAGNHRIRTLLVDDSPSSLRLLEATLANQAHIQVVGSAESGEEALEKAEALPPQLVLMDLQLPGMHGLDAARRLRQHHPQIQVIVVTSLDGVHLRSLCLQRGAQGFVSKHELPQALLSEVNRLFREP